MCGGRGVRVGPRERRPVGERLAGLGVDRLEVRDVLVPLEERRTRAREGVRAAEEPPDLVLDPRAVCVEQIRPLVRVAREVVLDDPVVRNFIEGRPTDHDRLVTEEAGA
jgi:hypothetical protein